LSKYRISTQNPGFCEQRIALIDPIRPILNELSLWGLSDWQSSEPAESLAGCGFYDRYDRPLPERLAVGVEPTTLRLTSPIVATCQACQCD